MMKIIYRVLPLLFLVITSCANEDTLLSVETEENGIFFNRANNRTVEEAAQIVKDALPVFSQTKSRNTNRTFDQTEVKLVVSSEKSRNSEFCDTLMYVFNFDNDEGFAIVATNRAVDGLLAITESGFLDPNAEPDNPGLSIYMLLAKNYLLNIAGKNIDTPKATRSISRGARYKTVIDTTYRNFIDPCLGTDLKWGQRVPEGIFCPNGACGCAVTAALMAMSQVGENFTLNLTYEDRDVSQILVVWIDILRHRRSGISCYNVSCSENIHNTIGRLCREIGHRAKCTYENNNGLESSSIKASDLRNALSSLSYKMTPYEDYNETKLIGYLENYHTVLMEGHTSGNSRGDVASSGNSKSGHMWVVDGVKHWLTHSYEYVSYDGINWSLSKDLGTNGYIYNHINWGWDGKANGYFRTTVFDSSYPWKLDPGSSNGTENYTVGLKMYSIY